MRWLQKLFDLLLFMDQTTIESLEGKSCGSSSFENPSKEIANRSLTWFMVKGI